MNEAILIVVLISYFLGLYVISRRTSDQKDAESFFTANKASKWYLVAYGMIGASLSGVTFISVPGEVGRSAMSYFQVVLGYVVGYFIIANVLLPLYYKHNLLSIYTYLGQRFGKKSYKTGAVFFLLSRIVGASFRLFLVASVLQLFFFDRYGIHFAVTVFVTLLLIWVYTYKGGMKTIVITDTIQTTFMIISLFASIGIIIHATGLSTTDLVAVIAKSDHARIFNWDWQSGLFFPKQFVGGALIALVMTGLDQDMMQKNLTCKNIGEAKKNIYSMTAALVVINLFFLLFGVLMYHFVQHQGIALPDRPDHLFPTLALDHFPIWGTALFLIGIIAAAYSSADSALTALTTSYYIDILGLSMEADEKKRYRVHAIFSFIIFVVILIFNYWSDQSVITTVLKVAGYTYGPLLGLFAFGILTKREVNDQLVPFISVLAVMATWLINQYSEILLFGYSFGYELLLVNGGITFIGLWLSRTIRQR